MYAGRKKSDFGKLRQCKGDMLMEKENMNQNNEKQEKPFNFWLFILGIFFGLLVLTAIVVGVPYLLMK
jgi:hypothetical protein